MRWDWMNLNMQLYFGDKSANPVYVSDNQN